MALCLPHQHTWQRTCDALLLTPPTPGRHTRGLLIRECTTCGLAEVWHGTPVQGGMRVTTHEHWTVEPAGPGLDQTRYTWDKTAEG